jgi:hypothetical protein
MRHLPWLTVALLVLGIAAGVGCGGGDDNGGDSVPATAAERAAVGQLRYCFEGAGALTARPREQIAELDRTPSGPETGDAERVLVAYWPDTGDVAHIYYARDAEGAQQVAENLSSALADDLSGGVEWKGRLIVVPDEESPPSEDEALLASDCLP